MRAQELVVQRGDVLQHMIECQDPVEFERDHPYLWLVHELTEAWGVLPTSDGKVVWTRMPGV